MVREVLSVEERKARRRASQEKYRLANLEKCKAATAATNAKHPERKRAADAKYKAENREKIRAAGRAYVAANAEKVNAITVKWQQENRERFVAYQKDYRVKNAEKEAQRKAVWRAVNGDREREYRRVWTAENKDKRCVVEQNRRERKRSGTGRLSPDLAQKLLVLQKNMCACCRTSLDDGYHLDHHMPLALGGPHEDANIQLLCPLCNRSKGAKHPVEFMQKRGFLL